MILSTLLTPLALLPFASAAGVHKMKLHKMPLQQQSFSPEAEGVSLAHKYGSQTAMQGSNNLRFARPAKNANGEDLLWTQEDINGGRSVPLSSEFEPCVMLRHHVSRLPRLP
jgi:saccharopepsin